MMLEADMDRDINIEKDIDMNIDMGMDKRFSWARTLTLTRT
jgi:hypothetical protein